MLPELKKEHEPVYLGTFFEIAVQMFTIAS